MGNVTSIFPKPANDGAEADTTEAHSRPIGDFNVSAASGAPADAGEERSDREIAARALCRFRRISETVRLDGRPIWETYLPEVDAMLAALGRKG